VARSCDFNGLLAGFGGPEIFGGVLASGIVAQGTFGPCGGGEFPQLPRRATAR
jgi:hypothetical protein